MKFFNIKLSIVVLMVICFTIIIGQITISSEYLITKNSIGKAKIGMAFSDLIKEYSSSKFTINDFNSRIDIFLNKSLILTVSSVDNKRIITDIYTKSSLFKTREGIFVGMPIKDLVRILPSLVLIQDPEDGFEYTIPENYQTKSSRLSISMISNDNNALGQNYKRQGDFFIATKIETNGKIDSITLFKTN